MRLGAVVTGRDAVADYIETSLLVRGVVPLGLDAVYSLAEEETGESTAQVSLALAAMKSRAGILGDAYPFIVNEVMVRARPEAHKSTYALLLLLSSGSVARQLFYEVPTPEMAVAFERVTATALAQLWGDRGRALRFGWPSDCGRPPEFPAAVAWLAKEIGVKPGAGYRQPRRKDGGVDVVAWRPFADRRSGFPIVLAQCTLQSDLTAKAADVDVRLWSSWLALDVEPVTALVFPGLTRKVVEWDEIALRSMIFDRQRLAGLAERVEVDADLKWVLATIQRLSEVLGAGEL